VEKLEKDFKKTQGAYTEVVKYFGEDPVRTEPSEFFSIFTKFAADYLVSFFFFFLFSLLEVKILFFLPIQKALKENELNAQKLIAKGKQAVSTSSSSFFSPSPKRFSC